MRRPRLAIAVVVLATGCEDSCWTDDYSFVRHGELVTVYGYDRSEDEACPGSFEALERQTASVMDFLGVDGSSRYVYRWMSDEFYRREGLCLDHAIACTSGGEAFTRSLPDMHEVAHMVMDDLPFLPCPEVLEEGLAMYLGEPHVRENSPANGPDIVDMLIAESIPDTWGSYTRAGHFVSFLVETYGRESIVQLCHDLPSPASLAEWDGAARRNFGVGLEQLLADYSEYPLCGEQQYRARLWECAGEPDFVISTATNSATIETGCDDPRAMQPYWQGYAGSYFRVYFERETLVHLDVTTTGRPEVTVVVSQECAACSAEPQFISNDATRVDRDFIYRAGMHEFLVVYEPGDVVELRVSGVIFF